LLAQPSAGVFALPRLVDVLPGVDKNAGIDEVRASCAARTTILIRAATVANGASGVLVLFCMICDRSSVGLYEDRGAA
jgi:hypothetical protein